MQPSSVAVSPRQVVLFATGGLLLVLFWAIESLLPHGAQEFAYFPFNPAPFPWSPMRGFTVEQAIRHASEVCVLGPALTALAFAIAPSVQPRSFARGRLPLSIVLLSTAAVAGVLFFVHRGRPFTDDELTYAVQAGLLADGKIADLSVPIWWLESFVIETRAGFTGKYLFGEPLVQVLGWWLGWPALMHVPIAGLGLAAFHRAVHIESGPRIALWSLILVAASPMFVFTAATGLSHVTSFTCVSVAGWGLAHTRNDRVWLGSATTAFALGFGLSVRPQSVVPFGIAMGMATLVSLVRRRRPGPLVLAVFVGLAWLALIAAYNRALTGSWTTLPWYLSVPVEHYGFGQVWLTDSFHHGFWTTVENLVTVLIRFNAWWLGWPWSLALIALAVGSRTVPKTSHTWLWGGLALLVFLIPYYSTGVSDTGPVYHFELLFPAAIVGAHALVAAMDRQPRVTTAALVVFFVLGTGSFFWIQVNRLERMSRRYEPIERRIAELQTQALVLYEVSSAESLRLGWLHSPFPMRVWSDSAPIVFLPRPDSIAGLQRVRARYPDRACRYFRIAPKTTSPELLDCDFARPLIARPLQAPGPPLRVLSTAEMLGWYDPIGELRRRRAEVPTR